MRWKDENQTGNLDWKDEVTSGGLQWKDEVPASIPGPGSLEVKKLFQSLREDPAEQAGSGIGVNIPKTSAKLQWKDEAGTSLPASSASFLQVENKLRNQPVTTATQIEDSQPTVGENLFLTNVLPIKQDDSTLKKIGKGAVNAGISVLSAPGEVLRQLSIQGGSILSGNGLAETPKNTTFIENILPEPASRSINKFAENNPIIGGAAKLGIEALTDPAAYIGAGEGKALLMPKGTGLDAGLLSGKEFITRKSAKVPDAVGKETEEIPVNVADDTTVAAREEVPVPGKMQELENGQKVRSLGVSGAEAEFTAPEVKRGLVNEMQPGMRGVYDPISNEGTLEQARALIEQDAGAVTRRILSNEPSTALDNTAGMLLVQRAQEAGDYTAAVDLVESLAAKATRQGQAIQALSMWGRLTPEGMLRYAEKVISQANAADKRMGFNGKRFKLTPEVAAKIDTLMKQAEGLEGRAREIATARALDLIAGQVPSSLLRKVSTLQTMSQLLNPKTAIRNIVGNAGFQGLENVSDVVGTGIDAATGLFTGQRSKVLPSLLTQGKGMARGGKLGLEDALLGIDTSTMAGTKFDLPTGRTFRSGPLSWAEKAMNIELRAGDRAFYQAAYDESLRQQMAAAGKSGKAVAEPTGAMLEIAHHDALYRTFQDNNALSNAFRGIKRALNAGKEFGLGDFILKYPKTPANLLARGLDYSPAGFVKTVFEASKPLMGRTFDQKAFVEAFSRAITGSASGVGLGAILHKLGLITGRGSEDRDVSALESQAGFGEYRLNVSRLKRFVLSGMDPEAAKLRKGDITVSYDWFQPWSIPLAIGADIDANKGTAKGVAGTLVNAFTTGINAFADQPVMQGLQTAFGQREFADAIPAILKGVPASFVPTLLNQVKQLVDSQKRNTYDPNFTAEMMNRATSRIPGLADNLPQSYGTLGQPLTTYQQGSGLTDNNAFNVFFNPAFINKYAPSPEAQMVIDIYKNTGETSQVPRVIQKYFLVGGKRIQLTPEEYSRMQQQVGELTQQGFAKVPTDVSDTEKIKAMGSVMTDAGKEARISILEGRGILVPESWTNDTGYMIRAIANGDTQRASAYTAKNAGNNAYKIYEYGKKHNMTDEQGNPDEKLSTVLSAVWSTQTGGQAKTAAFNFLLDACERGDEQEAIRWAQVAKQSGLPWGEMQTRIKQKAKLTTTGSKTPTMEQLLQGGYRVDPAIVQRAAWAMNQ